MIWHCITMKNNTTFYMAKIRVNLQVYVTRTNVRVHKLASIQTHLHVYRNCMLSITVAHPTLARKWSFELVRSVSIIRPTKLFWEVLHWHTVVLIASELHVWADDPEPRKLAHKHVHFLVWTGKWIAFWRKHQPDRLPTFYRCDLFA